MRSKHFFTLGVAGAGLTLMALTQGCGSSSSSAGTGGNEATTSSHSSTTTSSTTSGPGGSGGSIGGGNHDFSTAIPVAVGSPAGNNLGVLADAMTADFYSFTGKAGDRFIIEATAQGLSTDPNHDPNDETVTDTVITLYLPDKATIWAQDDDAWPRIGTDSTLFTQLPQDGTYYFTIEDCNAYAATHAGVGCADAANITTFNYDVFVGDLTASAAEVVGSGSASTTINYTVPQGNMAGQYGSVILAGNFATQSEVHTFSFTPPAATKTDPAARTRAYFWVQPYGAGDGDGTAVDVVLTAKDMAGNVLAKSDQQYYTNGDDPTDGAMQFSFPFDDQFAGDGLGAAYTLSVAVSNKTTIQPMKSYYIIQHYEGPDEYGQSEAEKADKSGATNDTALTAETLTTPSGVTAGNFFIDGNITSATDVDWFTAPVPSGMTLAFLICESSRDGSGLTGFKADLQGSTTGLTGPFTEITTLGPEAVPAKSDMMSPSAGAAVGSATSVVLKISATSLDVTNLGTYYHCQVAFGM
jgi:hypothetical protein